MSFWGLPSHRRTPHFSTFRSHFGIFHPRPGEYAAVISSKASNSSPDESGNIHFELCLQKAGGEMEGLGKVKGSGDVIQSGGIFA